MTILSTTRSDAVAQCGAQRATLGCLGAVLALPQGLDQAGLAAAAAGAEADKAMLRPPQLRQRVLQLDPSSALAAVVACVLRAGPLGAVAPERIGIVLATRHGSNAIVRQFSDRVRRGVAGPALFAGAGYNAGAGLAAMAAGVNGPSVALSGSRASLGAAIDRCRQLLLRGDADAMIAIVAESSQAGPQALAAAVGVRLALPGDTPWAAVALAPSAADHALRAVTMPFPWLHDDAATVLAWAAGVTA
jgi:hypothetical protein